MPDHTNTSYYAKFSNISQTFPKDMPFCGESFSEFVSKWNVSLSSLNLNTSETGAQDQLILQQCETHQKKICHQLQRSCTFHTDTESRAHHPEQIVICEKPNRRNPNWQDLKCAAHLPEQVKLVSPVEDYITQEPTDGSSTSKSSSSCERSDIWHSSTCDEHSRKNSEGSDYGDTNAGNFKFQNGGKKAQKKSVKLLGTQGKHPTCNTNCSAHKYRPHEDESFRQPQKVPNSKCLHCHMSPAIGSNKKHCEKPKVSESKLPHKVGCHLVPHQNDPQKSESSAKTEVDDKANYTGDTSKYDDTARLEIFKLRNRIKRYTEGLDNPILRKSHTFRAQNVISPSVKNLKSETLPISDCRSGYRSSPCSKSLFQSTKYPPLIQKNVPQMSPTASVKKKRRNSEICDQLLETQLESADCTTSSDVSSTVSDSQSKESSSDVSNRTEPHIRDREVRHPTHLGTKRNLYQKGNRSDKSVPQHTLSKNQMDTAERCTKHYHGNFQLQPKTVKRSQLRRPVPGQKPLYNYEQLPYQASEVYPDLICELEEKLSAISSQHATGKSVSPPSKHRLKKSF